MAQVAPTQEPSPTVPAVAPTAGPTALPVATGVTPAAVAQPAEAAAATTPAPEPPSVVSSTAGDTEPAASADAGAVTAVEGSVGPAPQSGGNTGAQVGPTPLTQAAAADPAASLASCDGTNRPDPLPAPGSPRGADFFRSFRDPLPPAALYNPPGPKRVGLQAGHWEVEQVPPELHGLQAGAVGGGKQEWQVNLDVARRAAALLEAAGVQVDVLPATVPPRYQANVFVAIHSDGDTTGSTRGFKVARPGFSSIPDVDDRLVDLINQKYGAATELPRDDEHISLRMRYYYAFNSRRYCHAVAPGVPQSIVEMAYLTSAADRQYLLGDPGRLAQGIADSIQAFLATEPS